MGEFFTDPDYYPRTHAYPYDTPSEGTTTALTLRSMPAIALFLVRIDILAQQIQMQKVSQAEKQRLACTGVRNHRNQRNAFQAYGQKANATTTRPWLPICVGRLRHWLFFIHPSAAFAVDFLEIKGSFVASLADNDLNQTMVTAITNLGRSMKLTVIGEHVDSFATLQALRERGAEYAQGLI